MKLVDLIIVGLIVIAGAIIGHAMAAEESKPVSRRISDAEIAIAERACLDKGMSLYLIREWDVPVGTTCIIR